MLSYDKQLKSLSQHLRKNMADAENMLWLKLTRKQLKRYQFYRQKIIGKYIVDFYRPKANLVLELDGGQHYSETGKAKDRARNDVLKSPLTPLCQRGGEKVEMVHWITRKAYEHSR